MLRIGLTGGMGSGKSTASAAFAALGVPVINADQIAHGLTRRGTPAIQNIVKEFGEDVLTPDGDLDRRQLARKVFNKPSDRRKLESILHPLIQAEMKHRLQTLHTPYCILEIPLLVEARLESFVDRVLVIEASESTRIRRIQQRDGRNEEDIIAILASQARDAERKAVAHDVLHNEGSLLEMENQVQALHQKYLTMAENTATA